MTPTKKGAFGWLRHPGFLVAIGVGLFVGFSVYTFFYAHGLSYLSSDPKACANCHIMNRQFDSWTKSSHHTVAVCVDCHLPTSFIGKYIAKADNGYRHSMAFTLQNFHEPIQIIDRNSDILQKNCVRCHKGIIHPLLISSVMDRQELACVHCHQGVGHGEYVGLGRNDQTVGEIP